MGLLFIIGIFVYIVSVIFLLVLYAEKNMNVTFWHILFLITPIINTIIVILYRDNWEKVKEFFNLKIFFDDLNK